jgi:hypothetical protein
MLIDMHSDHMLAFTAGNVDRAGCGLAGNSASRCIDAW